MSEEEKHPAKRAAMKLFDSEDVWYTEEETAEIIRREYAKSQWLPIESAPKDGIRILLHRNGWSAPICGQWYGTFWSYDYELGPFKHDPTHWQPLPSPPKPAEPFGIDPEEPIG